ncbi:hypothetical protein D3C84_960050 [compost metagenome]
MGFLGQRGFLGLQLIQFGAAEFAADLVGCAIAITLQLLRRDGGLGAGLALLDEVVALAGGPLGSDCWQADQHGDEQGDQDRVTHVGTSFRDGDAPWRALEF